MGEASMYDCIFLILLFYMYICILYVDILSNKSIYLSIYLYGSGLIYVVCVCLRMVVSNTYCVVFLFFFILCTPHAASGLSFCFSSSCVPPMLPVSLDCRFVCLHLVYLLCCQFLWIVVLFVFILCTSYVARFSGLSFCFSSSCVPPMLPLDCRFVCLLLVYPLCCQFLWIVVLFFFILCTPYLCCQFLWIFV
jgi:hypothetical protein